MAEQVREPPDSTGYSVAMRVETLRFFLKAIRFYLAILQRDVSAVEENESLKEILSFRVTDPENSPLRREAARAKRAEDWIAELIGPDQTEPTDQKWFNISHGVVRYLKSVGTLYIEHLRRNRDEFARGEDVVQVALQQVDETLTALEEKLSMGVFGSATEIPLILADALRAHARAVRVRASDLLDPAPAPPASANRERPPPVVLDTIPIIDLELKARCMDLFELFQTTAQPERFDSIITEATRVFEDRLRTLARQPSTCSGEELATAAFKPKGITPPLVVSSNEAEQQAVHLLFRGVFGFIRNPPHHRLMGPLQADRVLQVVGFLDYLLSVAQGATTPPRTPPGGAAAPASQPVPPAVPST